MSELKNTTYNLSEMHVKCIEKFIKLDLTPSRSAFIRQAINEFLDEELDNKNRCEDFLNA